MDSDLKARHVIVTESQRRTKEAVKEVCRHYRLACEDDSLSLTDSAKLLRDTLLKISELFSNMEVFTDEELELLKQQES